MKKILFSALLGLLTFALQGQSSDTTIFETWTSTVQEVMTGSSSGNELGMEDIPIVIGIKYLTIGTRQLGYRSIQYIPVDGSMVYQGDTWSGVLGYDPAERRMMFYFFERGECPVRHYVE